MSDNRQTPLTHRSTLKKIFEERKIIESKSPLLMQALDCGARALELANADGAQYIHEAAIMRYQASEPGAVLMCDQHTRAALKAAIFEIGKHRSALGGDRE